MQKKELKQIESLLLAKKDTLLREVEKRFKKYQDTSGGKLTEIVEIAASVLNGDLEILVAEEEARGLKQIEDALARIRAGNYGVCEQCGRAIKKARLKAIPFTTLCVNCKEEEERESGGKAAQTKCDWENTLGNAENGEMDEADKTSLRERKFTELEYDDRKN